MLPCDRAEPLLTDQSLPNSRRGICPVGGLGWCWEEGELFEQPGNSVRRFTSYIWMHACSPIGQGAESCSSSISQREAYFDGLLKYIRRPPTDSPDRMKGKKLVPEKLPIKPPLASHQPRSRYNGRTTSVSSPCSSTVLDPFRW